MENAKNSYLIIGKEQQRFLVFEEEIFFGEKGVLNLIWIPSILAVFKNSSWHYAQMCGFLIFFFFLEI